MRWVYDFKKRGHEICIVSTTFKLKRFKKGGYLWPYAWLQTKCYFLFQRLGIGIEGVDIRDVDVLHSHYGHNLVWGQILARKLGKPHFASTWGSDLNLASEVEKERLRQVFNDDLCKIVHTECCWMTNKALEMGCPREKILELNWGCDKERFKWTKKEAREHLRWDPTLKYVLYLRHFRPLYRPLEWLEIAKRVHQTYSDARFVLGGDGPLRVLAEQEVRKKGMDYVIIPRKVSPETAALMFCGSDVYLNTSDNDSIADSIKEAMMAAVPVVTYDSGGNGEFVPREFVVHIGDINGAAERVTALLRNEKLHSQVSRQVHEIALRHFDWKKNQDVVEKVYEEISR